MPLKLGSPLFLQVVVSSMGILSSVLDLAADLWAVVQYMLVGRYLWAALVLTLMGLSSVQLQLFSWVWMKADPSELYWSQHSHRFLIVLHMLQLGYLYRCFHGLQQGLSLCSQELPSEFELAYADFLSLDLSMLRLFESFLESTPQLTLVLAIVLLTGQAEYYQWFGILSSFLGISWALLDYHRSLRSCLPAKRNLGWSSSAIYFLWNFLLLGPRIFVISLFSAVYPYYIVMHFFSLWLVLMFWTWLQDTKFMPSPNYEWLYRMSVATILYFSWFNISGGRTRGRAVIHLIFIFSDSVLLVISVLTYITWLPSAILVPTYLITGAVCFLLGLVLRLIYYLWLHPRCFWEPDLVDGALGGAVDGALGGAVDGAMDGAMDGAGDEALHGARDGALHGSMDGALHGARDGALHGARDGALHGSMQRAGSILSPDYTTVLYNRRATQLAQNLFPMAQMSQLAQNLFPRAHMSVILPEKELIVTS